MQDIQVWRCCFLIIAIAIITLYSQFLHPMLRTEASFVDVVSFVWGAVCQQSTNLIVPTISARFASLTVSLATLAIFTSYSANIVALLQSPSHMIRTIDDLMKSPLKMALQEAGYNRYNYIQENISLLKKVYEEKIMPSGDDGWVSTTHITYTLIRVNKIHVCS